MPPAVRYAKKDIFKEVDEGLGVKIPRLIARAGDEIPPIYADLVNDDETTNEAPPAPVIDETASTVPGVTSVLPADSQPESGDAAAAKRGSRRRASGDDK
jgi:hypothetical protein